MAVLRLVMVFKTGVLEVVLRCRIQRDCKGWQVVASFLSMCMCMRVETPFYPRNCIISMFHGEKKEKE